MAVSEAWRLLLLYLISFIVTFHKQRHTVYAQDGPGILVRRAMFCFNNNLIYRGCNEAMRLDERGELKVPREATDVFCNGPCRAETELVLKCVDSIMSDFVFYNQATPRDIRNALHGGCSSSFARGNFDLRQYAPELGFGKAEKQLPGVIAAMVLGFAPLIL
ncbi:PREDICTED: uncharacterized protein LOC104816880 [Tarenaya hassleriana]|uniref:uncharacterized protein LOC104816880 n=1 Tax=Tarenaya hassleriana TaxID=28532 RepID=UPI00053C6AF0|nr:PREDICTED: uncharacterized protein LOC104816880 [Tarenaya hassleriana]